MNLKSMCQYLLIDYITELGCNPLFSLSDLVIVHIAGGGGGRLKNFFFCGGGGGGG